MSLFRNALRRALQEGLKEDYPTGGFRSIREPQKDDLDTVQIHLQKQILDEQRKSRVALERLAMRFTVEGTRLPPTVVYQNADVLAGQQNIEYWKYDIPTNHVVLINQISTNWFADCIWEFIVDNDVKEKGERIIGDPAGSPSNNPFKLPVWIIAKDFISWKASNNSTTDRNFGAYTDGLVVTKQVYDKMGGVRMRVG